jgi:hypothetical protein
VRGVNVGHVNVVGKVNDGVCEWNTAKGCDFFFFFLCICYKEILWLARECVNRTR